MKFRSITLTMMLAAALSVTAQMAPLASSHASTGKKPSSVSVPAEVMATKPAAKVNGAVLTELELRREMYTIFPYAQQHNNTFPKDLEPEIRKGALEMIIFEELLYQEAKRLNVAIAPEKLASSQKAFRRQFTEKAMYDQFLRTECSGSQAVLNEKIRRSLLIEKMMKTQVQQKSVVTLADAKAYYDKNPKQFEHGETVAIQTISIIPPAGASKEINEEAYDKIKDGLRLARATKSAQEFGLLAERISDDDWRTHMGERKTMEVSGLPPEVAKVVHSMKVGEVSDIIKVDRAYVIVRLNGHKLAGKTPFAEAKAKIQSDLRTQRTLETRSALNQKLRQNAKIEVL
jgi:peptidyl-prolyl cis-trans isomerase SurA